MRHTPAVPSRNTALSHSIQRFRAADSSDEDLPPEPIIPYQIFVNPVTRQVASIYISEEIVEPAKYDQLCHFLRTMSEGDEANIYINSPGGDMAAGIAIMQAMIECPGNVRTILSGTGYSCGAFLFLAGDERIVTEHSHLLLHHYSSQMRGKGSEQAAHVSSSLSWYRQIVNDLCAGFLSLEEINSMLEGKDIWMQADEIETRLGLQNQYRETLFESAQAEAAADA